MSSKESQNGKIIENYVKVGRVKTMSPILLFKLQNCNARRVECNITTHMSKGILAFSNSLHLYT